MRRDGIIFAGCCAAIMTGLTIVGDPGVIESGWRETGGIVAGAAIFRGCNMICSLWSSEPGAMTRSTVIHDTKVVKGCRHESGCLMAIDAVTISRHMIVVFAGRGNAVVTRDTIITDILVLKCGLGKCNGRVAHGTILGPNWDMWWVSLSVSAGRGHAIMTRHTIVNDAGVIENGWFETAPRRMADTTILRG